VAQDELGEWTVAITEENFVQLRAAKTKVVCRFCLSSLEQKYVGTTPDYSKLHVFAWNPSTTRRDHLIQSCAAFKVSPFFKEQRVQVAVQTYYEAKAKAANVRMPLAELQFHECVAARLGVRSNSLYAWLIGFAGFRHP
jgi:hypothetical protein